MSVTALITAAEGFPALERLVARARGEVILSFRILDPETPLRAPELRESGLQTWADLVGDADARGVRMRLLLADFDPLLTGGLHRKAWRAASGFAAAARGDTQILCAPHGQRAGRLWHLAMRGRLRAAMDGLRAEDAARLTPVQRALLRDGPVLRPATHHQKFAIADGRHVVIGGLDVDERRFDTPQHDRPPEETWHDISVALEDADFAGALRAHFADCWNAALDCGCASLAAPAQRMVLRSRPQSTAHRRLLRTFSAPCDGLARLAPDCRVKDHEEVLLRLIAGAKRNIYLETQFLRHRPLARALADAAASNAQLTLTLLLPAAPERVLFDGDDSWDARHAHGLQVAALVMLRDAYGPRLALLTPAQRRAAAPDQPAIAGAAPIYLHSKLALVDGTHAMIGSANLNGRSMRWDSEASILLNDPAFAKGLMERLAKKWLGEDADDPWRAETWRARAEADAARPPEARTGLILPYPMQRAERFSRRLFALPDDMF